jgi:predicted secreted protein
LNDGTFQFDNKTNSTKSLQFTGSGPLSTSDSADIDEDGYTPGSFTKGQFVRLFLANNNTGTPIKVLGSALTLSLHVSVTLEEVSTKDTDGNWQVQEPTGISYDISTSALIRGGDTITSSVGAQGLADLEDIHEAGEPVQWQIANVSGANQRTKGTVIASGSALIQNLQIQGPNRQNAQYSASLVGVGPYTVGS